MHYRVFYQTEAVKLVLDTHVERCRDGAFLLIAVNRHVVIIALIGQLMDQSRISVEREDYRLIWGEDCVILGIA